MPLVDLTLLFIIPSLSDGLGVFCTTEVNAWMSPRVEILLHHAIGECAHIS